MWAPSPADARRDADNALAAFSLRFSNVQRDARFAAARTRMGRYALAPSTLYRDSSLWTIRDAPDSSQAIYLEATSEGTRYMFRSRTNASYPATLGGERHYMRLRKVTGSDYEWITIVDHGIGTAPAARVAAALGAAMTAFEGRTEPELRADLRRYLPATSRHMGQVFHLDSARTARQADGSTTLRAVVRWQPDSIRRTAPAFAAWIDKYIMPSDYHLQLVDAGGARYLDLDGRPGQMILSLRARDRKLVALDGPARPMPDSLRFLMDASAKFKIFRVGFRKLVGDFTIERSPGDRALQFRFRQEPEWRFPLATNNLVRTPLRRPFEGRGVEMRLSVRDDLGSQTMSLRHIRLVVAESAIMRWLGNLGATAFGDFEGQSELEENRFLAGFFEALRRDIADQQP